MEHEIHWVAGKVSGEYEEFEGYEETEEGELTEEKRKKIIEASLPKNYPETRYVWANYFCLV